MQAMDYTDNKVKVTVVESHCPKYNPGDIIRFIGSELDKDNSDRVCMVAMQAIYPFIYAFRRGGNLKSGPYQCTDCGETVVFNIEIEE
ncbi:TIGR04076 family protein [Butyrivibrio sp. X503]|nr:TIGR04076 family protein [Butyrivibrio sp. X503]